MDPDTIELRAPNLHPLLEVQGTRSGFNAFIRACVMLNNAAQSRGVPDRFDWSITWDPATREDVLAIKGPNAAVNIRRYVQLDGMSRALPGGEA